MATPRQKDMIAARLQRVFRDAAKASIRTLLDTLVSALGDRRGADALAFGRSEIVLTYVESISHLVSVYGANVITDRARTKKWHEMTSLDECSPLETAGADVWIYRNKLYISPPECFCIVVLELS